MFNCGAKPFETRYQRYVETFNEAMVLLTGYFATQLVMSGRSVAMLQQIGYGLAGIISIFLVVTLVLLAVLMLKHSKLVLLNIYKRMVLRQRKAKHAAVNEIELYNCKSVNDDEKPKGTPLYDNSLNGSLPAINRDSTIGPLVAGPITGNALTDLQQVIDNKNNAYGTASKLISSRMDESYDLQDLQRITIESEKPNPLEELIRDIEMNESEEEESEAPAPVVMKQRRKSAFKGRGSTPVSAQNGVSLPLETQNALVHGDNLETHINMELESIENKEDKPSERQKEDKVLTVVDQKEK